ncbi:hypothetical protein TNIN_210761 [Trichonephila inaurata madagascariensis]|uniref:Uncharacterized protein n=1 Tax=Trichonephila inaurata madagascariensis TaxID=2747483 RepID=A0A8X7CI11_9ARAC|nr:hypothetical protein TNIN_210761 [Trichonephila inaurata madagascariensis]
MLDEGFRATAPSIRPSSDPTISRGTIQVKVSFLPLQSSRWSFSNTLARPARCFNLHTKASDAVEDVRGTFEPTSIPLLDTEGA